MNEIERLRSLLREASAKLRQVCDADDNLGIYPSAVQGYKDERDYEQRDGFKNGWNACVMEFTPKASEGCLNLAERIDAYLKGDTNG